MRTATILALLASSLTLPSVLALPVPQFAPQNTPQNDDLLKPISDAMNELLGSNNGFGNGWTFPTHMTWRNEMLM